MEGSRGQPLQEKYSKWYLVIMNYYFEYREISYLPTTDSQTVIIAPHNISETVADIVQFQKRLGRQCHYLQPLPSTGKQPSQSNCQNNNAHTGFALLLYQATPIV